MEIMLDMVAYGQERVRARAIRSSNGKIFASVYKSGSQRVKDEELGLRLSSYVRRFSGLVSVEICITKAIAKSVSKARRADMVGRWCGFKPDIDNVMKWILDVMTSVGFWEDDKVVVKLVGSKVWGETDGILIKVEEIE